VDIQSFRELSTPLGQQTLQAAESRQPKRADFLSHFQQLSRTYPTEIARAALETAILRGEAAIKFPFAANLFFNREALEQSSPFEVSSYRSRRFQGFQRLVDLGCSVGGDTLSLAQVAPSIGIERDSLRLLMAQANLRAMGLADQADLVRGDLYNPLPLRPDSGTGLFFDPARREAGRRVYSVEDYQPPLSLVSSWLKDYPAVGVKISPGVKIDQLLSYDAEVEFISLRGELKEAVLWFGPLKSTRRRATLLPGPYSLVSDDPFQDGSGPSLPLRPPADYLYEPDPAVLRAGLVRHLGQQLSAAQLDPDIAYLTAQVRHSTPFARAWIVESWFPFGLKRLRAYLADRRVGRLVVKKRGSPLEPEKLIRDLRLQGDQERVVFLTHLKGEPIVVVCFSGEV
jgi:THUMP domain-like